MFYKVLGAISLLGLVVIASCKKDNSNGMDFGSKSTVSMSVNDKAWKAKMAFLVAVPPEESDDDFYFVGISGAEVDVVSGDSFEDTEGLNIYIAIPKSKFRNPKGTYNFVSEESMNIDYQAYAMFIQSSGQENIDMYVTVGSEGSQGTLKIDGFKIGKSKSIYGYTGEYETYTQLSGTFSMTLTQVITQEGQTPKTLKITNGKFNVYDGLNLGNFFGSYSDIKEVLKVK